MRLITAARPETGEKYYVLIYDCGGDEPVKARILEEHSNLTNKGYSAILGLRDVKPRFTHAEIPKLEADLPKDIQQSIDSGDLHPGRYGNRGVVPGRDHALLQKIDPAITLEAIRDRFQIQLRKPTTWNSAPRPAERP